MSTSVPLPKDTFLSKIHSLCTTMTLEAQQAAISKARDLGFNVDRGIVSLEESFINLANARDTLLDAIDKRQLVQLPISAQKELLGILEAISQSLQNLTAGTDEVENLAAHIENLNSAIWRWGLHNLSKEVLGYQRKLNQIKAQEVELARLSAELRQTLSVANKVSDATVKIERSGVEAASALEEVKKTASDAASLDSDLQAINNKISALYESVQQREKQSGEMTAAIKVSSNELSSLSANIKQFYSEVEEYRRKLNEAAEKTNALLESSQKAFDKLLKETSASTQHDSEELKKSAEANHATLQTAVQTAITSLNQQISSLVTHTEDSLAKVQTKLQADASELFKGVNERCTALITAAEKQVETMQASLERRSTDTIEVNREKTDQLIEDLAKLKESIHEQIQQATGFRLFGAFQARQNEIVGAKKYWVKALGLLVALSVALTIWLVTEAREVNSLTFAFYVKLSLAIPLAFAITFCTVQYSRERRLEEEYAFKSSISVSLNPYRELVEKILKEGAAAADLTKYADFVIDSIRNVFTPPTEKVFDAENKGITEKTLKQTAEIIGTAVKAAKQ